MTREDAEQAITEHKYTERKNYYKGKRKDAKSLQIYQCHNCQLFHLTSMSKQDVRRIKKKIKRRLNK